MRSKTTSRLKLLVILLCLLSLNACAHFGRSGGERVQTGKASWYGSDFHGKPTASGTPYNMYDLTAAHRTLPLGTKAKVTNLDNGRDVKVTINDRGPFVGRRILDLSYGAAKELGMVDTGIANIRLEVISLGQNRYDGGSYSIQFGAFSERDNAETLRRQLSSKGFSSTIDTVKSEGRTLYRVKMGFYKSLDTAESARKPLLAEGITCVVVGS